jgi:NADPH-dependent curcumin reductase CurA
MIESHSEQQRQQLSACHWQPRQTLHHVDAHRSQRRGEYPMTRRKNRQWILNARPAGKLTGEEFFWNEAPIPQPSDGQVLIRTLWLSVDPAQRIWMSRDSYKPAVPLGDVMQSFAVGQVLVSRHPEFKPGDLVRGDFSWQDYVVTDGKGFGGMQKLPPGVPLNLALSLFGVNGLTAYFGITEIGQIKAGETVVVSSAAGATGSVAGQIAKIKGCRVIGTAGGKEKCDWLVKEAHFDAAIDYKSEDIGARLSELCPNGIDVFFDNVGGAVLNEVLARINIKARIVLCGSISKSDPSEPGPANYSNLVARRGRMEGFTGLDYPARIPEAFEALGRWQREGTLVHKEDVVFGLENAPRALLRLFTGENFGKQLVRVADAAA